MTTRLNIVLIGKTGNGKSDTGNSIIDEKGFGFSDASYSKTTRVDVRTSIIGPYNIRVVDTPGLRETRFLESSPGRMLDYLKTALSVCHDEIHLFLVVLIFGNPFEAEDLGVVKDLFKSDNADEMWKRTAVLFTHGREFEMRYGNSPRAFQSWCKAQTGELGKLLKSVYYRCLLFENLQPDQQRKQEQQQEVLNMANDVRMKEGPFTAEVLKEPSCCNIL
ncbi:immune-associated nucleotide-binding protein 9-like [Aplysia californica]|uniref:Immune-associated nucleotide-binding protein 9-like n=1 Tax=Aplysia californica TaxID=6500 RepID=A0ABM1VTL1_APLCA|nr:immune-associated nucleotide-binding protein 9-like [Aplysia californica]